MAKMSGRGSHGSPRHTESYGAGPAGSGDGSPLLGPGPGGRAGRVKQLKDKDSENPVRQTPPGSAPKGMKTYAEE